MNPADLPERAQYILMMFGMDADWRDPNEERSHVSGLQHALLCGTKALRHYPEDSEMIVAALLHDVARPMSDIFHGEVIAYILKDRVRPAIFEALMIHGELQDQMLKNGGKLGPGYHRLTAEATCLAAWDYTSFDPEGDMAPITEFLPHIAKVFSD